MTKLQDFALSGARVQIRRLLLFVHTALSHGSKPLIAIAILLGSARAASVTVAYWIDGGMPLRSLYRLVPAEMAAGCILVAVLLAEQCVRDGARRLAAYVPAVIGAAVVSGFASAPLIIFMRGQGVPWPDAPHAQFRMLNTAMFYSFDALARGGLAAFVFANRERLLASIRQLRDAELERTRAQRDLANSHLLAMQATLQPETLLSTLATLRTLYESDSRKADHRLAAFIEHLRSLSTAIRV